VPPAGLRIPITIPGDMGDAVAVLARHDDPDIEAPVVVTLWDAPSTPDAAA
jgi:hypothetical protein